MQKILVVDDAEVNRELLKSILENEYIVETAVNGKQALQKLQDYHSDTAAVLLDLQMPIIDGFTVIAEMKRKGWIERVPVLIISGETGPEIESQCFELGVSDFIHKPFDASIVRNRVKSTIEHFSRRNRLEQKVEEQAEALKKQSHIIQMQAERLSDARPFNKLMMEYRSVIMEVETRLKVLNAVFSEEYKRNPFEAIKSRLKTPESIYSKLERKGYPVTIENIREQVADVAGLRVICSFPDDIYRLAELLIRQDDIILLKEKDYIKTPKTNGYRSLHLILKVPIFLPNIKKYMRVEVQFRTIAMDFWASLEHKLKYKKDIHDTGEIEQRLKACADSIEALDYQMQEIRDKIDSSGR
jgi:ppGpp synthetase/RelA/SpoT-type nucleotidyltranferase/FixJ family two-component response regulator